MISYPIYNHDTFEFDNLTFVRNIGPNLVDDGLIGWVEFDENDTDTLKYVVHEVTQQTRSWTNQEEYEREYDKVMEYVISLKI